MKSVLAVAGISVAVFMASCGGGAKKEKTPKTDTVVKKDTVTIKEEKPSIVDIAVADTNFSILVDLLKTAGWVDSLNMEGRSFTVFAPTNAAFRKLGQKAIDKLKSDPKKLAETLKYHVVSGTYQSGDLEGYEELDALSGHVIKITRKDGSIVVGASAKGGTVTQANIEAKNGVIHVIDAVITPPSKKGTAKKPVVTNDKIDDKPVDNNTDKSKDDGNDKTDKFGGTGDKDKTKTDKFGGDGNKENTGGDKKDKFGGK